MVYVPPEILKIILKLRSKLAFKDRIAHLDSIISPLPPPLEVFHPRISNVWRHTQRFGRLEFSRMVAEIVGQNTITSSFFIYEYDHLGIRHDVSYFYHTLKYDNEGYAILDVINRGFYFYF